MEHVLSPGLGLPGSRSTGGWSLLRNQISTSPCRDGPLGHAVVLLHCSSLTGGKAVGALGDAVDGFTDEWRGVISQSEQVGKEEGGDE